MTSPIGVDVQIKGEPENVEKAVEKAAYKNFKHAAASVRKSIIAGIQISKDTIGWITTNKKTKRGKRIRKRIYKPSPVGHPVYSHRNKSFVSRGVRFDADADDAVIGFAKSKYGDVMEVHEKGGQRFGQQFDQRPTVQPGLEANLERFAGDWRGSIGG